MIRIDQLTFGYGRQPLFGDISCSMPDGCITALIGLNGAGKSTLLRLCARLEKPWSGEICIDGKNISSYTAKPYAHTLSYLPQARPVPSIPVRTLVMHGRFARLGPSRRPQAQDEEAVDRALEWTALSQLQHRDVSSLSGGQQQKAYLAMAIAQDAQHILLDEPLTHLDVGYRLELMEVIHGLRAANKCIVMVVHDLSLLQQNCDQAVVLHNGTVAFSGKPQTLSQSGVIEHVFGVRPVMQESVTFERFVHDPKVSV